MISTRYAKANNPYIENYDPSKPTTYLIYLHGNNLYAWAMEQFLPIGGFRFVSPYTKFPLYSIYQILNTIPDDAPKGYIFEVDLEYPQHLHDNHSDYPLAPEILEISRNMYSPLQKAKFPTEPVQLKITPNLRNKTRYIVHYRNLKMYVRLGMKIKKIHRVLEFDQSPWLKSYMDLNCCND